MVPTMNTIPDVFSAIFWFWIFMIGAGIALAIIVVLILILGDVKFERFDLHHFNIPENTDPGEAFNNIINYVEKLGYHGIRRDHKYQFILDAVLKINIELIKESRPLIRYYVDIDTWFVILLIILAFMSWFLLAVIIGLIIYLRYDSVKREIFSAITTILSRK